jgi:NADH-quinone oxidoreductase subunit I
MDAVKMIKFLKSMLVGSLSLAKGLAVTLKYYLKPPVTVQYPTQKLQMTERYRGLVDLRPEKCIVCYQCVKICPTACLAISHKEADKKKELETFTYNMELCCFCGLCQQVCPTSAVIMNKIYEISVYDRKKFDIDLLNREKYAEWINPTVK